MCRYAAVRSDAKLFEFVERFIECGEETKAMVRLKRTIG
jgi:hypothetical protein